MDDLKIFVLTNGVRELDKSYEQIDYNLYFDYSNSPHKCYIDLLHLAMTNDNDEHGVLILEDDLILCKDFINKIKNAIEQYQDSIINFFWQPLRNIKTSIEKRGFCFTQCVYYPKGMIKKFYYDLLEPDFSYARNIKQALEKNHITFVNFRPHYVQHIGDKSLIWPKLMIRRSKNFIDDIKEEKEKE